MMKVKVLTTTRNFKDTKVATMKDKGMIGWEIVEWSVNG